MYTVLLVDDEKSVLHILTNSIDWQEMGVDTLLCAADGKSALEQFAGQKIDLLVTDIRMPGMDGLELIRRVRALQPSTHCILLTAYGEFQYAQEAIRLGVDNYLLKPVAREEVCQTVQAALDNIYRNRAGSENLLRENTLRRWAAGSIGAEELGERASVLGWDLYCPRFCVLCMAPRKNGSLTVCRASVTALLKMQCQVEGFWDEKGRYTLILSGKTLNTEELSRQISELAAYEDFEKDAVMAFGTVVTQYELLHTSYHAAGDALETANPADGQVFVRLDDTAQGFDADLLTEELRVLFFNADIDDGSAGFLHLAQKLYRNGWDATVFPKVCRACLHVMTQEFPMQKTLQEQLYDLSKSISHPTDVDSGCDGVAALLQGTQRLFACSFAEYSPMVQHMIRYVRDGVMNGEGVCIKALAAGSGVTPAYLGHMFKKETGIFFNDYLLHCRLERSVILMRNPNRKIKDIAETVGFTSTSYFVKCFREYKGVSPAKYRVTWAEMGGAP